MRVAVGAMRRQIVWPILRETLLLVALGSAAGLPVGLALGRLVRSQLFGIAPTDPATLAAAALPLLVVAIPSSWLPARRAAKLDPMRALRRE